LYPHHDRINEIRECRREVHCSHCQICLLHPSRTSCLTHCCVPPRSAGHVTNYYLRAENMSTSCPLYLSVVCVTWCMLAWPSCCFLSLGTGINIMMTSRTCRQRDS
jgi:hypothetical protein